MAERLENSIIHAGKQTLWRDGQPYIEYVEPVTPQRVSEAFAKAANIGFRPRDPEQFPEDAEYEGLTNLEVTAARSWQKAAEGDIDFIHLVTDRTAGKPKQQIEQLTVTMTLQDFARQIAEIEAVDPTPLTITATATSTITDVEPITIDTRTGIKTPEQLLQGL